MAAPWEKYKQPEASQGGPWARYQQSPPRQRGTGEELARQGGLTARYLMEGAADAASIFTDPIAQGMNALLPGDPIGSLRDTSRQAADAMGLPQPETGLERVVGAGSRALVGTAATLGAGGPVANAPGVLGSAGRQFVASPGMQLAAGASGGASAQTAAEAGAGPGGQVVAGLAGALVPAATGATVRGLVRGGEQGRQNVLANSEQFQRSGAGSPSVGQATEGRVARGAESLLARTPGGAGVMADAADATQEGIGQRVRALADDLSPRASPEQAGRAIEKGITGPGGFMSEFRRKASTLYDEVDKFVPGTTPMNVQRTKAALDALASPTPGAARTSQALSNPRIGVLQQALSDDLAAAGNGQLPYAAVKNLRSRMGDLIADSTFATDVPTKQLRQVYAALSQDLDDAVKASGNPQAIQAARRANNYYRSGMDRMEQLERVIERNGGPEKVFAAATSGSREGATTLRAVMQSLPQEQRKTLAAAMIRRMGRANPSAQDDIGEQFSTERFLTMWNTLAPEAKTTLFARFGPTYVRDMEAIAKTAANIRQGSEVFRNPSGTAQAATQIATTGSLLYAAATGQLGAAGVLASGVGIANGIARGMTSPAFVGWLAKQTTAPSAAISVQLANLRKAAEEADDEDAMAAADAIEAALSEQATEQ